MTDIEKDEISGRSTTGHEWDGIKELDTPMPRWWLWTFYACIVFSIGYWVWYPSWPTLSGNWQGLSHSTARKVLEKDVRARDAKRTPWFKKFAALPLSEIAKNHDLLNYALAGGKTIFADNCAPCHGSQGAGGHYYPVLVDDDWLWGGTLDAIATTIRHGIRSPTDEDTRDTPMPSFGVDEILTKKQIADVAEYVLSFSKRDQNKAAATRGKQIFADNCSSCHGDKAEGSHDLGAPRLNDAIWLYGNTRQDIVNQVSKPRLGIMPAWKTRLDDVSIKQVAIYVHSLGGGE